MDNGLFYSAIIKVGEDDSGKPIIPIYATRKFVTNLADISAIIEGEKSGEVGIYLKNGHYFCIEADFNLIVENWNRANEIACCKE